MIYLSSVSHSKNFFHCITSENALLKLKLEFIIASLLENFQKNYIAKLGVQDRGDQD